MHCRKSSLPRDSVDKALKNHRGRGSTGVPLRMVPRSGYLEHNPSHRYMQRTFGKYKTKLRRVLELAGMPARYGWYGNNAALRPSLQKPMSAVVATGTTGNEALHSATAIVRSGVSSCTSSCTLSKLPMMPQYGRGHCARCIGMPFLHAFLGVS